jgi:acyl carrier protein
MLDYRNRVVWHGGMNMISRAALLKELLAIIEDDLGTVPAGITEASNLRESLGMDSVDMITVISRVEQNYRIRMSHEELAKLETVSDILDMITFKSSENATAKAA